MIECLDPAVDFYEAALDIIHLKDPYKSTLALIIGSLAILHYEAAIALSMACVML